MTVYQKLFRILGAPIIFSSTIIYFAISMIYIIYIIYLYIQFTLIQYYISLHASTCTNKLIKKIIIKRIKITIFIPFCKMLRQKYIHNYFYFKTFIDLLFMLNKVIYYLNLSFLFQFKVIILSVSREEKYFYKKC